MKTLKQFSDKDRDYHAYQARQNFIREQLSREHAYDEARRARDEAIKEKLEQPMIPMMLGLRAITQK